MEAIQVITGVRTHMLTNESDNMDSGKNVAVYFTQVSHRKSKYIHVSKDYIIIGSV